MPNKTKLTGRRRHRRNRDRRPVPAGPVERVVRAHRIAACGRQGEPPTSSVLQESFFSGVKRVASGASERCSGAVNSEANVWCTTPNTDPISSDTGTQISTLRKSVAVIASIDKARGDSNRKANADAKP